MEYLSGYLDSESDCSQAEENDNLSLNQADDINTTDEGSNYDLIKYIDDMKARFLPSRKLGRAFFSDQILVF